MSQQPNITARTGQDAHTPTLIEFVAEIDRLIDAQKPSVHIWNYCVWNRKAVLRDAVRHDMSVRKVLSHHELMPGRVAANTESLLADLSACNSYDSDKATIKALVDALETLLHTHGQNIVGWDWDRARESLSLAKEGQQ